MPQKGFLVLENGAVFDGEWIGSSEAIEGEVVFNTSMTGYQEILTDPSYAEQIIVFCYPLIGNYGCNPTDNESDTFALAGAIFGEVCEVPSHYEADQTTTTYLTDRGIHGLVHVDTRALVKMIRKEGTMRGKILPSLPNTVNWDQKHHPYPIVGSVSTSEIQTFPGKGPHLVMMDFGYKKSIATMLQDQGCQVTVVPYHTSAEEIAALRPDGLVLSNGPGDPEELASIYPTIKALSESYPTLGICLGHQLLALAHGARTEKLLFGHRGSNHPVKDLGTNKVYITSQNHGYEVLQESLVGTLFDVTHLNVNDGTVEGMKHQTLPIESVQFHPEAHAGPSDTAFILTNFVNGLKEGVYAAS